MLIAEHSMCQPGRPVPTDGRPRTARRAWPPSRARSRGRRPWRTRRPRPARPPGAGPGRAGPAARRPATTRSGRRSSRRRSDRRGRGRGDVSTRATISGMWSVARGRTSGTVIRSAAASARKRAVPAVGEVADRFARGGRAADDLVVDVGDVHHPGDPKPAVAQVADEQVGEQERPEVADVGRPVDRRPAAVDADVTRLEGDELALLPAQRVEQAEAHRTGTTTATARAATARPAPSSPRRFPVEALTFTAAGRIPRSVGDRRAHRGSAIAEARPGADDRDVDRGGPVTRRREPADHVA